MSKLHAAAVLAGGLHNHRPAPRPPRITSANEGDHVCPRCRLFIADTEVDSAFICSCVPRGAITQEHVAISRLLVMSMHIAANGDEREREAATDRAKAYVLELAIALGVEAW